MSSHHHWCEIRGHWFECSQEHEPDYIGTKEDSEQGYPVELRDDCPQCAGFHLWKIPRWLGFFWRYWICSRMTSPYWEWRVAKMRCLGCGKPPTREELMLHTIFKMVDDHICRECLHFPRPECGPNCDFCQAVNEEDLRE